MIRRALIGAVSVIVAYILVGYGAVEAEWLDESFYQKSSTIMGGVASVIGLLSLTRPSISRSDIEAIEVESIERVSKLSSDIKEAQQARDATQEEIAKLEERKAQMEILVRKASLSLFLQEQLKTEQAKISDVINSNKTLRESLSSYADVSRRLVALNEEIQRDENADLMLEIIRASRPRSEARLEITGVLGAYVRAFEALSGSILGRTLR